MQEGGQAFLSGLAHCSLLSGPSDSDALTLIITDCAGYRFNDRADREDHAGGHAAADAG